MELERILESTERLRDKGYSTRKTKRRPKLDKLIDKGLSLREMNEQYGRSINFIWRYMKCTGKYSEWKSKRFRLVGHHKVIIKPVIDGMLRKGIWNTKEIGKAARITREAARQYIKRTKQEGILEENRERGKSKKRTRRHLCHVIKLIALQKTKEEGFAVGKAVECYLSRKTYRGKPMVETLKDFYENWYEARAKGENQGYYKLGEPFGFNATTARRLLLRVGLSSLSNKLRK